MKVGSFQCFARSTTPRGSRTTSGSVAAHATAVVYDRAGAGRSERDRAPRTLERLADDLGHLLGAFPGPLVLVGHSWGGPVIRTLSARGAFDVRGLVLVDPSDENVDAIFAPRVERRISLTAPVRAALARARLCRMIARAGRHQPADVHTDLRLHLRRRAPRQMAEEIIDFLPALRVLREHPERLDALHTIDMVIVTGTRGAADPGSLRPAMNAGHAVTANRFARARLVEAPNSGHDVMFDDPAIVVREILTLVAP